MNLKTHILFGCAMLISWCGFSQSGDFSPYDLFKIDQVIEAVASPDGKHIAYTVNKEKPIEEGKGSDYRELYLYHLESGKSKAFITGKNRMTSLAWKPDGKTLTFLARMGDVSGTQVHGIDIDGGASYPITRIAGGLIAYDWHPDGSKIALTAYRRPFGSTPSSLQNIGFDAEIYEEGVVYRWLFLYDLASQKLTQLTEEGAVFDFSWSPKGDQILAQIAPSSLIDDSYMAKKLHLINPQTQSAKQLIDNPGKLTKMAWSPDGAHIAFVSAVDISDPVSGSLFIIPADNQSPFTEVRNYSKGFEGSIKDVDWLDEQTVIYAADESVDVTLSSMKVGKKKRKILLESGKVVFSSFSMSNDMAILIGNTSSHPGELFTFSLDQKELSRKTEHNSWISDIKMGKQEKVSYKARDGLKIEGVLIYPQDYQEGQRYPLICYIHGGPESCVNDGWATRYSMWGQMAASKGYFVFMPNYRASSGRGVDYAKADHMDLADEEFNDVLDGVDYLVEKGYVDREKVGIGGGSYGGYFSAWAATKHSKHFAASVVFVGISNQISKRNCTDIPVEDYQVHWRIWTHENPELIYDRSPVKYAKGSTTPTLILHGKEDTRVIPTQSLELYRQLKLHGKAPVRLVWYPGEGHGNRNNPAQLDYALRTLEWFDYYLKSDKPKDKKPSRNLKYNLDALR